MGQKFVFRFSGDTTEGTKDMKETLGGKGANLAEMCRIGIPVPPGITVSALACAEFQGDSENFSTLEAEIKEGVHFLEELTGKLQGSPEKPLLLSVRSGAAISMPGMMDTVLNLGINDQVAAGIARATGNLRFTWDLYRRFIDMFGDVVMGVDHKYFEAALAKMKKDRKVENDTDLNANDLEELTTIYKEIFKKHTGRDLPTDPWEQLMLAVKAVFGSWNNERAVKYRKINRIEGLLGTAVNIQTMVYGNTGQLSGTGVLFTRNPATGEDKLFGEYLINAQGEDVVAGIRTPEPIARLQDEMPEVYAQLYDYIKKVEAHYQDLQDIEFTVEDGTLYILQTRSGKRTGTAALKIARDMVAEGLSSQTHAIQKLVQPEHLEQLLHPQFKNREEYLAQVIAKGLPASPGAAVGQVVFHADEAEAAHGEGKKVILVRTETSPEDVGGMDAAQGILTTRGGITSHAAVVARGWGKCCVAGCEALSVDYDKKTVSLGGKVIFQEGDWIALNGSSGEVILGQHELVEPDLTEDFMAFLSWLEDYSSMKVRTNADTPEAALKALQFGAQGIGLCRTEHMFFQEGRLEVFREMIMAQSPEERQIALDRLKLLQKVDFSSILQEMDGMPVTIRLLDPPLHEFLPMEPEEQEEMAAKMGIQVSQIQRRVASLKEVNPMLGLRGCRLGIVFPEITKMQVAAILEAGLALKAKGYHPQPEIMIPLVAATEELQHQIGLIHQVAEELLQAKNENLDFRIGCMIETPRAALRAEEFAHLVEFFSFGTNDLTQMTFGYSRDDATKFMPAYLSKKILPSDPFQILDQKGVGELIKIAVERGKKANPSLEIGICGEHGGEPSSVEFCYHRGLNYVSCSPFRVPIARLAIAKAELSIVKKNTMEKAKG